MDLVYCSIAKDSVWQRRIHGVEFRVLVYDGSKEPKLGHFPDTYHREMRASTNMQTVVLECIHPVMKKNFFSYLIYTSGLCDYPKLFHVICYMLLHPKSLKYFLGVTGKTYKVQKMSCYVWELNLNPSTTQKML